jgi:hypothetical protein
VTNSIRSASPNRRKNGEARAPGCTAEQTSCQVPGSISSAVRVPPPGCSAASYTVTSRPARANVTAAARPFGPAPMIETDPK